ncbi:MAG: hypothetical protein ACJLS2_01430 [Microcella pacifica]|jgi:hypothetical protein|uniref:Uncharacterized protein n=1 Tax=Microcella pacifica TaxID=2591847 RepID=A0A9E5JNF7_9MICO|nr:hypothetical protein [Microcella pacifica]NHF62730.1 hypothetical protein [Microcella pacifica]
MYAALWRVLPGPLAVRVLIVLVLVASILLALVTWVFPWIAETFLQQESVVESMS